MRTQLPPEELRQLLDRLLAEVSTELQADNRLREEILAAEQEDPQRFAQNVKT